MYKGRKIGVVIPAYNEELFIEEVIRTMPRFVDRIYAVDDASTDRTRKILNSVPDRRLRTVFHRRQMGAGGAMISGYRLGLKEHVDVVAIMAGDGQMDPEILDKIIDPVVDGRADYSKGNRLSSPKHWLGMPPFRLFGNIVLTFAVRVASGYWTMTDPLNGYTAISRKALGKINLDSVENDYTFETDLLVKLNTVGARATNVPMASRYRGEKSKILYPRFVASMLRLLFKDYLWRIRTKYLQGSQASYRRERQIA